MSIRDMGGVLTKDTLKSINKRLSHANMYLSRYGTMHEGVARLRIRLLSERVHCSYQVQNKTFGSNTQ